MKLELTPDELLSTTRAVRKRLDLERPVEREVLEECLNLAQQAPTASYSQNWHFVVVTDAGKRAALGELWRQVAYPYLQRGGGPREGQMARIGDAVVHLAEHIHEVPVHVIPCVLGRYEGTSNPMVASMFGSIIPAAWSFMLALRSRGLGAAWTTLHLGYEREAAALLGIPDTVTQVALLPVAYTIGDDFKPAARKPAREVTYWNQWGQKSHGDPID
jgi:nitroreductase